MKNRTITNIYPAQKGIDDGDMLLWRALPLRQKQSLGPFVFIDHYRHQSLRGLGDRPHPHAGIEVISYIMEGGVEHRDSMGFFDTLHAGDAQWICAGSGIIHAEQPTSARHGLQLWTSLPPDKKMLKPSYRAHQKEDIPIIHKDNGEIRVIAGEVDGQTGPLQTVTDAVFVYVKLAPNSTLSLSVPADELGIYVTLGKLLLDDNRTLGSDGLAVLSDGDSIHLRTADEAVELAILGGKPVVGDIVFDGPFVMDTPERIRQAYQDYRSGKMGVLE